MTKNGNILINFASRKITNKKSNEFRDHKACHQLSKTYYIDIERDLCQDSSNAILPTYTHICTYIFAQCLHVYDFIRNIFRQRN